MSRSRLTEKFSVNELTAVAQQDVRTMPIFIEPVRTYGAFHVFDCWRDYLQEEGGDS